MNKYNEVLEFLQNLSDEQIEYMLGIKTNNEINIENFLKELGVAPCILGFKYLKNAIEIVLEDKDTIESITKTIYPQVAENFETTPSRVERAIRHAIESCWGKMDKDLKQEIFFNEIHKPTNSMYIAYACNYIKNLKSSQDKRPRQKVLNVN